MVFFAVRFKVLHYVFIQDNVVPGFYEIQFGSSGRNLRPHVERDDVFRSQPLGDSVVSERAVDGKASSNNIPYLHNGRMAMMMMMTMMTTYRPKHIKLLHPMRKVVNEKTLTTFLYVTLHNPDNENNQHVIRDSLVISGG